MPGWESNVPGSFEREWKRTEVYSPVCIPSTATGLLTCPVRSYWNEGALTRILENLPENAIKLTPRGGRVEVRVMEQDERGILEVEDTGVGISEATRSKIFQSFKQESEGLDRKYEGRGFGLSIVHHLTEALNGDIVVQTQKGTGHLLFRPASSVS